MSIFCTECGNKLNDEARFCTECGNQVIEVPDNEANDNAGQQSDKSQSSVDLFDCFAAIHDLKGEEQDKFFAENMSGAALNIVNRIGNNKIENLIEDAPELNERKHGFVIHVKDSLYLAALAGYEMFLAVWEQEGRPLDKFKSEPLIDKLANDWLDALENEYDKHADEMPDEVKTIMVRYVGFRMDGIEERHKEELEVLPHAVFEKIEGAHTSSVIWGYFVGIAESKSRYRTVSKS